MYHGIHEISFIQSINWNEAVAFRMNIFQNSRMNILQNSIMKIYIFPLIFLSVISSFQSKVNFWIPGQLFSPASSLLKYQHFYLFKVASVSALLLVQPALVLALLLFQSSTSTANSHSDGDGNTFQNRTSRYHPGHEFDDKFCSTLLHKV